MNVGSTFQVTPFQPSSSCIPVLLRLRQVTPSLLSLHSTFSPDPSFRAWTDSSSSHTVLVQMIFVNGVCYKLRSKNQCLSIHPVRRMVASFWSFSSATLVIHASTQSTSAIGYNYTPWANFSLLSIWLKHISSNRLIHWWTTLNATNYVHFANGSIWHISICSFTDHLNLLPSTVGKPKIVSLRSTGTFSSHILTWPQPHSAIRCPILFHPRWPLCAQTISWCRHISSTHSWDITGYWFTRYAYKPMTKSHCFHGYHPFLFLFLSICKVPPWGMTCCDFTIFVVWQASQLSVPSGTWS